MSTHTPRRASRDDGWIALPGLFDQSEFNDADGLEVRAQPLVLHRGRVLYGLYVRDSRAAREAFPRPAA